VSDYRLDDRASGVRSLAVAKDSSVASASRLALRPTQPPVQWVVRVLSPGVKHSQGVMLTTYPHVVLRSRMSRSYTSSPPCPLHVVATQLYLTLDTYKTKSDMKGLVINWVWEKLIAGTSDVPVYMCSRLWG
jgi:hypothetical protein